ncbi:MAG: hypothetical protein HOP03_17730 [Lysobacter sp.]|nr:hypothetical protein [Lysobacter sp.]
MKSAGITVVVVASLVGGILLYEALKPERMNEPTAAEIKTQMDKLRTEAAQKNPNLPQSDAIKEEATRQASAMLKDSDGETRARTAAGLFFGSYFMNTRARPAYCRQRGVDLTPFVTAFDQTHRAELTRAREILARAGIDPESMAPKLQAEFVSLVEQDMKDFATGAQVQPESACELFNQNSKIIAEAIVLPADVKQALMATY